MSNLSYNGQIIEQRQTDNYVNLTQMAKANDVQLKHFNESEFAKKYLKALQESISRDSRLMEVKGFGADKTTWGHPLVAIAFGQWISPEFHVWCNLNIQTLITKGSVSLAPVEQPQLPPNKVALEISRDVREITDNLTDNPRLAQFLIDHAISGIMPSQATLTGDSLQGVVEIALEMGFQVDHSSRSQLGKFVKKLCGQLNQPEKRLVNGTTREVACYPSNHPEVRQAITNFFTK
jgi:hypothetical protein